MRDRADDAGGRRLRDMLAAHLDDDGVQLGSAAWIITALRADLPNAP